MLCPTCNTEMRIAHTTNTIEQEHGGIQVYTNHVLTCINDKCPDKGEHTVKHLIAQQ